MSADLHELGLGIVRQAEEWAVKLALDSSAIRQAVALLFPAHTISIFVDPRDGHVAIFAHPEDRKGVAAVKRALEDQGYGVDDQVLTPDQINDRDSAWIRVAVSPGLGTKRADEAMPTIPPNDGIEDPPKSGFPSWPSPLTATIAGSLLGSGIGYGVGKAAPALLPPGFGQNLPVTGAVLGAAAGALPGLAWWGVNKLNNHSGTEAWPTDGPPPGQLTKPHLKEDPTQFLLDWSTTNAPYAHVSDQDGQGFSLMNLRRRAMVDRAVRRFEHIKGGEDTLGGEADVSIDALGRTLWEAEASPELAGQAMGTVYAARQMPDPYAREGIATGVQLGRLAASAGGGYATGLMAGKVLNMLIGTPVSAGHYGLAGAALGALGQILPRIYGQ